MAATTEDKKLLDLFDEGLSLLLFLETCREPTDSFLIQSKVKEAMRICEEATRLTSVAGVFSTNESVDEISTDNLRLFLLPAILGTLAIKLTRPNRMEVVDTSDIYFRDFLQRCNDYGVSDVEIPPPASLDKEELERAFSKDQPCMFDLYGAAKTRAAKIQRYHKQKALETELESLSEVIALPGVEDEVKRDYYLKLIKSYVNKAEEELDCLLAEKRILTHMQNTKIDRETKKRPKHFKPQPLKPVIITKDEVQKAVYGAGYPSIPAMTVQEFYDKRVRDGDFPDPEKAKATPGTSLQNMDYTEQVRDKEKAEEEEKMERDDEEYLDRQRNMDDYKDIHKRGEGNRFNRS